MPTRPCPSPARRLFVRPDDLSVAGRMAHDIRREREACLAAGIESVNRARLCTIAATRRMLLLVACVLLAMPARPLSAQADQPQTAPAQPEPLCLTPECPEAAEVKEEPRKFEFNQTLGTSAAIDPFGPTPHEVVAAMIKMAGVGADDVVFDLGSGDGRIPIAAAKQAGARGVGIELRSELVVQSREAAEEAGVADRVKFLEADIFKSDISSATVVLLYLFPRTLLKLRAKFLDELRPGTRIIAYNYGIEGWPRDREEPVEECGDYGHGGTFYYWIVPANASGVWKASIATGSNEDYPLELRVDQTYQKADGKALAKGREVPLQDVQLKGDSLRFSLELPDFPGPQPLSLVATIDGDRIVGHVERNTSAAGGGDASPRLKWQASRDPATRISLDPDQR